MGFKKDKGSGIEYAGNTMIKFDTKAAREYIKNNIYQPIGDVPVWVLISLGISEAMKVKAEEGKKNAEC